MLSQPLFEKGLECKAVFEESLNAEPSTPNMMCGSPELELNTLAQQEDIDHYTRDPAFGQ